MASRDRERRGTGQHCCRAGSLSVRSQPRLDRGVVMGAPELSSHPGFPPLFGLQPIVEKPLSFRSPWFHLGTLKQRTPLLLSFKTWGPQPLVIPCSSFQFLGCSHRNGFPWGRPAVLKALRTFILPFQYLGLGFSFNSSTYSCKKFELPHADRKRNLNCFQFSSN